MRRDKKIMLAILAMLALESITLAQTSIGDIRQNPEELFAYACGLYKRSFYDMALPEFERFLKSAPDDANADTAAYLKILCLNKLNRIEEMLAEARLFREKYKKSNLTDEVGILATEKLLSQNKFADAKDILSSMRSSKRMAIAEYATYHLATCLNTEGQYQEALNLYKEMAYKPFDEHYPYRPYAARQYVDHLMRENQLDSAMALLEKMTASSALQAELKEEVLFLSGEIYIKQNNKDKATEAFESCIAQFPNGKYAKWCRLYRIRLASGAQNYEKALQLTQDIREHHPDEAFGEIDYMQAEALMQTKRYGEALPFFQRVETDERSSSELKMTSAYYSVYCLIASRLYAEAISKAENFLKNYPKTTLKGDILLWNSQAQLANGNLVDAEKLCSQAISLFVDMPEKLDEAVKLQIEILEKGKKWNEAIAILQQQAELAPAGSKLQAIRLTQAANCAQKAQNIPLAIELYGSITKKSQDKETVFAAFNGILQLQLTGKQYSEALDTIKKMKVNCPEGKLPQLLLAEADILFCLEKTDEAIKTLQQIQTQYGGNASIAAKARFMLASIYLNKNQEAQALPILDKFFAENAGMEQLTTQFLFMAGDAYAHNGQHSLAQNTWKKILQLKDTSENELQDAQLRIIRDKIETRNNIPTTIKELEQLLNSMAKSEHPSSHLQAEALSLQAEAFMLDDKAELARISAEASLKIQTEETKTIARAMYVLAYIYYKLEKNAEMANRFATQCYILTNDSMYGPASMAISIEAFRLLKKTEQANEVLKELSQKYPLWLAQHPELQQ